MQKEILKVLKTNHCQLSLDNLAHKLNVHDLAQLNTALIDLNHEFKVIQTQTQNVYLLEDSFYKAGTLRMNPKGFGFVSDLTNPDAENDFVPPTMTNGAISGDVVVYKVLQNGNDNKTFAQIVEIATRDKEFVIGEIVQSRDGRFLDFIPTDLTLANLRTVMVNKKDFDLKPNMLIKAKILEAKDRKLFVRLKKIIGDSTKAADRIFSIAEEFNIKTEFHFKTIKNAEEVNIPVIQEKAEMQRRAQTSLIDTLLVTIDGADSKDLDDSIYVEKTPQGYKLIVAIADVSHYVKPRTPLDNEALSRGNSTYLANKVIPMLPKILSDDLCSLNPNTEKFALACEMEFDNAGKMLTKKVYETIMISKARLTYHEVNEYFANKIWTKQDEVAKMLDVAKELHLLIGQIKESNGMINLDVREAKIVMDKNSNVVEIKARETGESEKLIENFMVSANEAVAELVFEKELPFVYRNHQKPQEEELVEWYATIKSFGIDPKLTNAQMIDPKNLNKTLRQIDNQISDPIQNELLHLSLLRHMEKAKYGLENIGHFGLASKCYTHFTSPIRRYSDLMVHRYLKQYIIQNDTREFGLERNEEFISKACPIINDTEQTSVDCEREVIKVCMVEYLTNKVGQVFDGTISIALKFGFFVQLENMVEGLVHISTLGDGLVYDEKHYTLTKPDNTFYRMGQKVKVKLVGADLKKRTIDFELVK
ncbi:ribonuclease R [Williamsoniiplasma lucivorax]|uniref:Ribonuclease R n=1 Tax=Williamsoniiplasma lucivorax TaxID=209274 RepID=A0A2S5RES0_9MOLU|nr:ribonuclease R [Williamsoniiplasma lucivorax]PPE05811.1 ribonuclease R [Williamsoniiplasma lucivorax]